MCYHARMVGFSPHLFWDCDANTLDEEVHARFVIGRVLSRGTFADWQELKRRYGLARLRAEVVCIRDLDPKSHAFCAAYFDIAPEAFRCSQTRLSSAAL